MSNLSDPALPADALPAASLSDRQTDLTRQLIVDAALDLLERVPIPELTNRLIAQQAHMSERTVYRHFGTREHLLDTLATGIGQRLDLPPVPDSIDGLVRYPYALYPRYEAQAALTRAALHPEVFHRIRDTLARKRWESIRILFATHAPQADPHARERAAANVRFFLAATAWNYYRSYFGMDLEEAMEAVSDAIGHIVQGLKP